MKKIVAIRNKLRSDEGVSLSVALLYFLVCAVLASMIVAAATSSNGRIAAVIKNKQADLATLSGARLTANELKNDAVIIVEQAEIDTYDDAETSSDSEENTDFTFLGRTYYETTDTAGAASKSSLAEFSGYTEISDDNFSILSGKIRDIYNSYLNTFGEPDGKESFLNGRLSMVPGKKNILSQTPSAYTITVNGHDDLKADAKMIFSTDMTVDVKVTSGDSVCYVHSVPVISTYFQYEQAEDNGETSNRDNNQDQEADGDNNKTGSKHTKQTVTKTTIITFPEVRLSRS